MQFLEYQTPSAWKSKDFKDCSWIDILSKNQREELLMLAKSLPANEDEWLTIAKSDLALKTWYLIISGNIFDNFRPMCAAAVAALGFIRTTIS